MSNSITSSTAAYLTQGLGTSKSSAKTSTAKDPISEFLAYQKMTPQEKVRDALLKKHGLTEDTLAQLPADERAKIEEEIRQDILKEFKGKMAEKGILVDMSA